MAVRPHLVSLVWSGGWMERAVLFTPAYGPSRVPLESLSDSTEAPNGWEPGLMTGLDNLLPFQRKGLRGGGRLPEIRVREGKLQIEM